MVYCGLHSFSEVLMLTQSYAPQVKKLLVDSEGDPPQYTLKREGGGPLFSLTDQEWQDIKEGKYDPPKK